MDTYILFTSLAVTFYAGLSIIVLGYLCITFTDWATNKIINIRRQYNLCKRIKNRKDFSIQEALKSCDIVPIKDDEEPLYELQVELAPSLESEMQLEDHKPSGRCLNSTISNRLYPHAIKEGHTILFKKQPLTCAFCRDGRCYSNSECENKLPYKENEGE